MVPRGDSVVVTGGAGFIGSHLVDRLLDDAHAQVVVLDDLSRGTPDNLSRHAGDPRLTIVRGDIADAAAVANAFRGAGTVYHLAALSTVMGAARDVARAFRTNVLGTFNVLRAATAEGVRRVVFASSREVYGEPLAIPVQEDHPLLAINTYGASKVSGEALCRSFRRELGLETIVLRLANVYGPRDIGRVIPLWLQRARDGAELEVFGGKQVIDFVWVGHVVEAFLRAARLDGSLPPINVASGTGTTLVDLASRIAQLTSASTRLQLRPARSIEVTKYIAAIDRQRELLEIEPDLDPLEHLGEVAAVARTPLRV